MFPNQVNKEIDSNTPSSLLSDKTSSENKQESELDNKFQTRQEKFNLEENFSQIKENAISKELSLSNNNRNKILMQKRLNAKTNLEDNLSLDKVLKISKDAYTKLNNEEIHISDFSKIINLFHCQNIDEKFKGLIGLRKLLSLDNAPISEIIDLKTVPELISILDNPLYEFKYEAIWCLCNIAAGNPEQGNSIIISGGLDSILNMLDCPVEDIKVNTVWLVSNLASNSSKTRDILIQKKFLDKILTILASTNNENLINLSIWALSNFFRVKPIPNLDICNKVFKAVARAVLLDKNEKEDFLCDVGFFLSILTKNYDKFIQEIIDTGLLQKIIKYLDSKNKFIIINFLRIIGNISSIDNANYTQKLIDLGVLDKLKYTLFNENLSIRKESCFILSNIAAGTQKQIEILIEHNFLQIMYKIFKNDNQKVKKEVLMCICNMTAVENEIYMKKLIDDNILMIITEILKSEDNTYIIIGLETLTNILTFGKKNGKIKEFQIECEKIGITDILEKLQMHDNQIIYEKTLQILENYFEIDI